MNHAEIIDAKGSETIASVCKVSRAHVRVWKCRRIPRSVYADLIEAFPDITLSMLREGEPANANTPTRKAAA